MIQFNSYQPVDYPDVNLPKYPGAIRAEDIYTPHTNEDFEYNRRRFLNTPVDEEIDWSRFDPSGESESQESSDYETTDYSSENTSKTTNIPASKQERAKYLMRRLQDELKLSKAQAAGVAGNIDIESEFDTKAVGDGGKALGLGQWHPDRRVGMDILNMSFEDQVSYLIEDLKTESTWNKLGGLNKLRTIKSSEDAASFVDKNFERSDGSLRDRRRQLAKYYESLRKGGVLR